MLAARRLLALKSFSFEGQLHYFLEERDKLFFDFLGLFVRDFAVKQCFWHELLDFCCVRDYPGATGYRIGLVAFVNGLLDSLRGHPGQLLWARHEHLDKSLYHLGTSFHILVLLFSPREAVFIEDKKMRGLMASHQHMTQTKYNIHYDEITA